MKKVSLLLLLSVFAVAVWYGIQKARPSRYQVECSFVCLPGSMRPLAVGDKAFAAKGKSSSQYASSVEWSRTKVKDFLAGKFYGDPRKEAGTLAERFLRGNAKSVYSVDEVYAALKSIRVEPLSRDSNGVRLTMETSSCDLALSVMKFVVDDFSRSIDEEEEYRFGKVLDTIESKIKHRERRRMDSAGLVDLRAEIKEKFAATRTSVYIIRPPEIKRHEGYRVSHSMRRSRINLLDRFYRLISRVTHPNVPQRKYALTQAGKRLVGRVVPQPLTQEDLDAFN